MIKMCGIGAIIGSSSQDMEAFMQPIKTRGDSFNENVKLSNATLSCNRLKIVDRENAFQPVYNEDKTIFAVFNGEIYNYKKLHKKLEDKGHTFRTNSDSEILVHGYEEWGEELPKYLDGQFAFVIYNAKSEEFLAARDPFGIKPLYYSKIEGCYYFASEAKQLVDFVTQIQIVKPGYLITSEVTKRFYFPEKDIIETIRKLFDQAVKKRVQTDLPIAVFLSGGIDSTAVLSTARKYHPNVTAICMGRLWKGDNSDLWHARKHCQENKIRLIEVDPPTEKELFDLIPEIVRITESFEPNMIKQSGLSYFLAKAARDNGFKVVLSGEGADEIFLGYPEFQSLSEKKMIQKSKRFFDDLSQTQLQRVDRTSMYNSIEVRVPFMDKKFVGFCMNIPTKWKIKNGISKWILRQAFSDRLPSYIANRKKIVLSEGMGHKSNSMHDGMFTAMVNDLVSNQELKQLQKLYPEYNITTKEEAYYLQFYIKYGYNKVVLPKRPLVNTKSTLSINLNKKVYSVLKKRHYNRESPYLDQELKQRISMAVKEKKPVQLVGFWGIGPKSEVDKHDKVACEQLQNLQREVQKIYPQGIRFTFILPVEHGLNNGFPMKKIAKYTGSVQKLFAKYEFNWIYLDELWRKYSINSLSINEILKNKEENWWGKIVHSVIFENSAKKHNRRDHPIVAAQKYYIMRNLEKEMLEKEFSQGIFHTYSGSRLRSVLPNMPTLHFFSHKRKSNCPWFETQD